MRFGARFRRTCLSIAIILPVTLSGTAARQVRLEKVPPAAELDEGPLVAPGEAPDLVLLYTGGVVGYVEPCG